MRTTRVFFFFWIFIFGHRPKITFFIEVLVRWGCTLKWPMPILILWKSYFTTFSTLKLNNSKTTHHVLTTWLFLKIWIKLRLLNIMLTSSDQPRRRRGNLNSVLTLVTLRLPRRPRGQSEDVGNRIYWHSLIYIFQKCQVCQDRISSFWIIQL